MSGEIRTWRDHCLELLAEGEALKLAGSALGHWIAQRMRPQELRDMLADYYRAQDALEAGRRAPTTPEADR